jgi:hypothetical protein
MFFEGTLEEDWMVGMSRTHLARPHMIARFYDLICVMTRLYCIVMYYSVLYCYFV